MRSLSQWINCCSAASSFVTHQPALAKRRKRGRLSPMSVNTTELAQLRSHGSTVFVSETSACRPKGRGFHTVILAGFSYPSCTKLKWENYVNCCVSKAVLAEVYSILKIIKAYNSFRWFSLILMFFAADRDSA